MYKKFFASYFFICFLIIASLSLSNTTSEKMRGNAMALVAPFWNFFYSYSLRIEADDNSLSTEKLERLALENQLLKNQLGFLKQQFDQLATLKNRLLELKQVQAPEFKELSSLYQKSISRISNEIKLQTDMIPAKVIYRTVDQWNSIIWINVGNDHNLEHNIVAKNSIVLADQAIVGIIDYVGKSQSRVRLISDSRLNPSVRALRGGEQDQLVAYQIDRLTQSLSPKMLSVLGKESQFLEKLHSIKNALSPHKKTWYLAKGELQGSLFPVGYGPVILKGTGFNYDFADQYGEARDLRTGETGRPNDLVIPLLKVNDILVTTGMDGVFPEGLKVATVSKIETLQEGDYFYQIEAEPLAQNIESLSLVFVIPPLLKEPLSTLP